MNFSDETVNKAKARENSFKGFFGTVKRFLRSDWLAEEVGWRDIDADRALYTQIADAQTKVHEGMCDNFNTFQVRGPAAAHIDPRGIGHPLLRVRDSAGPPRRSSRHSPTWSPSATPTSTGRRQRPRQSTCSRRPRCT